MIESISHSRDPATGATVLTAKLASPVTNADGTAIPTVVSSATPLATTQVAIASNPALTFNKITSWVNYLNGCLSTTAAANACPHADQAKLVSADYLQNSKDFDEDFSTLFSESDRSGVKGSEMRNPNILYIGRYAGSTTDDLAIVEVTIRQPRTGPLAGNQPTPIEYTKILIFKRDDVTESAVRETVGRSTMDFVITEGRSAISASVQDLAQSILDRYGTGLVVTSVNMQDAQPPAQVQESFYDAVKARAFSPSLSSGR